MKPTKIIDAQFEIVSIHPRRRPLWVSAVIGGIRAFHGLRILITVALLLISVATLATDGAVTRAIHQSLFGW